jgi:hypothetical protein
MDVVHVDDIEPLRPRPRLDVRPVRHVPARTDNERGAEPPSDRGEHVSIVDEVPGNEMAGGLQELCFRDGDAVLAAAIAVEVVQDADSHVWCSV